MNTKIALHINEIIKETPDAISICFAQPEQAFYNSPQKPDSKLSYIFNLNLLYYEQKKIQTRF